MMFKKIISLVEEMQSDPSKYLENFRELYELWEDRNFNEDNLYSDIVYFGCECDEIPKGLERKNFSKKWLETCDKRERDFFEFHKKDVERFFKNFFSYAQKINRDFIEVILDICPERRKEFLTTLDDFGCEDYLTAELSVKVTALSRLVQHMLEKSPPDPKLKNVLEIIENFLVKNTDEEPECLMQVCFFENFIKDFTSEEKLKNGLFKLFVSFLGPESKRLCRDNDVCWGVKSPFIYD